MNEIDIFKIRENLKMTQQEFGELIGVDRRTVINYEQGKKIPSSKIKILELLLANGIQEGSVQKKGSNTHKATFSSDLELENMKREILELKDHIKTLKDFLDEKNKLAEMYKQKIILLEDKLNG